MSLEITRLQVVGLKSNLQAVVRTLHRLGCVHIDEITEAPDVSARPLTLDRETLQSQEELTLLVAQIEGLLGALQATEKPPQGDTSERALDEARQGVAELSPRIQALASRRQQLEDELASLPRYEATLQKLLPFIPSSVQEAGNAAAALLVSREHIGLLESIGKQVLNLTVGKADVVATDLDVSTRAMLVVFPQEHAAEIEELLARHDVSRLRLPSELGQGAPDKALAVLRNRKEMIPKELEALQKQLEEFAAHWGARLVGWRGALREELARYRVLQSFGETEMTFVLVGWAPAREVDRIRAALQEKVGDLVTLETLPLIHELEKKVPIALSNPRLIRPFESLVRLLALPRYGEIDPAALMALFLPFIFGMILGDVGYGTLLLLLCLVMLRKMKRGMMRDMVIVLATGSGWAIVFGFLYGEAFGNLGEELLHMKAIWINRASADEVSQLLLVSLVVGTVHIFLGLVLGIIEAVKHKSRAHLLERGGMLVGLIGLLLFVGTATGLLPVVFRTIAIGALLVGIGLIGASLGCLGFLMGPIEFISLIGNILSYLRIAAIGLASVYLAKVANEMAGKLGNVIVGITVAVLIHVLNLVLGAFSPTIHSLRLHYVEFFRKFYEGGGRPYKPFKAEHLSGD